MRTSSLRLLPCSLVATAGLALAQGGAPPVEAPWIGYPTSAYPEGLGTSAGVLADLTGDGHLDALTVSYPSNGRLSVLVGDGLGGFAPAVPYALPSGSRALATADLDADGDLDVVVADDGFGAATNAVSVFLNLGDGTLAAPTSWGIGGIARGLTVADVNGDGKLDVLGALSASVGLALGNGDGTFQAPGLFLASSGVRDLAAGDLDGDGDQDLVVAHTSQELSVFDNIGIGFAFPVVHQGVPSSFFNDGTSVVLADVDLDGDLDALLSNESAGLGPGGPGLHAASLLRGDGAGGFAPVETLLLDPAADGAVDLTVADLDQDGWPDLLAVTVDGTWQVLPGDGLGGFGAPVTHTTAGGPKAIATGDLDGDGDREVVTVSSASVQISVHRQGPSGFAEPSPTDVIPPAGAPASSSRLRAADLDLDGDLDLVVGWSENFNSVYGLSILFGQGDGTFAPPVTSIEPEFPEWLTTGDVDGDGDVDLVWLDGWGTWSASLRLRRNNGDGTFAPTQVLAGGFCEQDAGLVLADVNGDGAPEVLLYDCFSTLHVLPNLGGGAFGSELTTSIPGGTGGLAAGDVDGDGLGDLLTNSAVQGYVELRLGLGGGQFGPPTTLTTGRGVEGIELADLDLDGLPDVVAAYSLDGGGVSVLFGLGGGAFAPSQDLPATYTGFAGGLAVGDLDGDGLPDVSLAEGSTGQVSTWRNLGARVFAPGLRLGTGYGPTSAAVGLVDGDQVPDLVALVEPSGQGSWYYPAVVVLPGLADPWADLGGGLSGAAGEPHLTGAGPATPGANLRLELEDAAPSATAFLVAGLTPLNLPLLGGTLVPTPDVVLPHLTGPGGQAQLMLGWPELVPTGLELRFQTWVLDASGPQGVTASNALLATQP